MAIKSCEVILSIQKIVHSFTSFLSKSHNKNINDYDLLMITRTMEEDYYKN